MVLYGRYVIVKCMQRINDCLTYDTAIFRRDQKLSTGFLPLDSCYEVHYSESSRYKSGKQKHTCTRTPNDTFDVLSYRIVN
ncbi:hypothetical protein VIBNISOn1_190015 [Vibrio nigripulchritudo SOn1]|uniref:Uncharacterized protein n=1 Tax=Vibrio nigripulchritudo SOn1 TaxID=1238450 RepID=A0AAV2VPZ3_9VIBR|nr:hypothetical protein VIBNISOn1_190015 [Vibrio nigripulchritudo SOn1]